MAKRDWLKFYTSFKGRATRYDFNVYYALVMLIGSLVAGFIDWLIQGDAVLLMQAPTVFSNIWSLVFVISTAAICCRRLHDMNYSGWWQVLVYTLPLVFIGFTASKMDIATLQDPLAVLFSMMTAFLAVLVYILVFFAILSCVRGTKGPNRFGADPLEVVNVTE